MVRGFTIIFFVTLALIPFIQKANGLKCYACLPPCDKPEEGVCLVGLDRCLKVTNKAGTTKSCGVEGACKPFKAIKDTACDECDGDSCNSALVAQYSSMTIFIGFSIAIAVYVLM